MSGAVTDVPFGKEITSMFGKFNSVVKEQNTGQNLNAVTKKSKKGKVRPGSVFSFSHFLALITSQLKVQKH